MTRRGKAASCAAWRSLMKARRIVARVVVRSARSILALSRFEKQSANNVSRCSGIKKVIAISGMHCANCALNIEKNLKKIKGVESASVSYASERAVVDFDESKVGEETLRERSVYEMKTVF